MGSALSEFLVKIGFKTEGADKATKETKKVKEALSGLDANIGKLGKGLAKSIIGYTSWIAVILKTASAIKAQAKYTISMNETLDAQASSLKKTTEQTRAHLLALKAMGKTYDEIEKSQTLKKRYNELIKLGEAMRLPDAAKGITAVNDLITSFQGLKVTGQYVFQWIYYYYQQYAKEPLLTIKGYMDKLRKWVQDNMKDISKKVSKVLAQITNGGVKLLDDVIQVAGWIKNGINDVIDTLSNLPPVVQAVGIGVAAVFLLMNSSVVGTYAKIALFILLFDDLVTYVNGGESAFSSFWSAIINGALVAYDFLVGVYNIVIGIINGINKVRNFFRGSDNQIEMIDYANYYSWDKENGGLVNWGSDMNGFATAMGEAFGGFVDGVVEGITEGIAALVSGGSGEGEGTPDYAVNGGDTTTNNNSTNNTNITIDVVQNIASNDPQVAGGEAAAGIYQAAYDAVKATVT